MTTDIKAALLEIAAIEAANQAFEKRRAALEHLHDMCTRTIAELEEEELLKGELILVLENLQAGRISFDEALGMCRIIAATGENAILSQEKAESLWKLHADHVITFKELLFLTRVSQKEQESNSAKEVYEA